MKISKRKFSEMFEKRGLSVKELQKNGIDIDALQESYPIIKKRFERQYKINREAIRKLAKE